MRRKTLLVCLATGFCLSASSFAADSVLGRMFTDGVTGGTGSDYNWDRETVYISPVNTSGTGGRYRMGQLPLSQGSFFITIPGGIPGGTYSVFSINMGKFEGGAVGFDYRDPIAIPEGAGQVQNVQFPTRGHYSVLCHQLCPEWGSNPWVWGDSFYQTFEATTPHVTRIATRLAGKEGDGAALSLNCAICQTNGGAPSTWPQISPTRNVFIAGTTFVFEFVFDVNYLSNEVSLIPGEEYAVRYWVGEGSESTSFAIFARPDNGTGYPDGMAYSGDTALSNTDLYGWISGGAPGTVVNYSPTDQGNLVLFGSPLGSSNKYGQTFLASGNALAAVELLYTVGCNPNPSIPITIRLFDGVGGTQIGPSKTCYSVTDLCQGRVAACWTPGEAPMTPGEVYYLEFDATPAGVDFDVWQMNQSFPGVGAYQNGTSLGEVDLPLTIAEYVGDDPVATPTATPPPPDRDGDGVSDANEGGKAPAAGQTNGYLPDTDGDGLSDGTEDDNRNGLWDSGSETRAFSRDTDGDGYQDGIEDLILLTNPLSGSDPANPYTDSDNDGLPNGSDPNPSDGDTDGDRYLDGYEAVKISVFAVVEVNQKPDLGDVNLNGSRDNGDAQLILNFFASLNAPGLDFKLTDVDRNGTIDNGDAQRSLNFFASIDPYMPVN